MAQRQGKSKSRKPGTTARVSSAAKSRSASGRSSATPGKRSTSASGGGRGTGADRRLAEAADRMELTELLHRYAHAVDTGNFGVLAQVFTPDAVVDFGSVDEYVEGDSVVKGLGPIRAWFEKALAPFPDVLHFMTNHRIELFGDEAETETLMQVLHMSMGGIYRGHAIRTAEGWRFDRFRLEERSFEEAAARLTAHMTAVQGGTVSPARPNMAPAARHAVAATPDDRSRTERAESILDQVFTPSWRNHGGGVPVKTPGGEAFARLAVEHCYADAWARGGRFSVQDRSLFTLVALATLGCTDELKLHVRGALNLGHAPDDIAELFVQILPYVGTPRMVQAMRLAGEVFREAGVGASA